MKLDVVRTQFGADATNSLLFIDSVFECYGLEDEIRDQKKHSETAIPLGEYEIKFRTVGGFHAKYTKRYGAMHKGMLELQDVPNFDYILIHTGNTDEHTSGCILVMDNQENNILIKDGFGGKSTQAYKRIYPMIASALTRNEKVTIEILDQEDLLKEKVQTLDDESSEEYKISKKVWEKLAEINGNILSLDAKIDGKQIL
jgi:hypothetical protein